MLGVIASPERGAPRFISYDENKISRENFEILPMNVRPLVYAGAMNEIENKCFVCDSPAVTNLYPAPMCRSCHADWAE